MDKLSEYIPLLIILVSFIVTIIGKKKKPSVTQETTLPGKSIGELFEEKKAPQPVTDSLPKVAVEKNQRRPVEKPKQQVNQHQEIQPGKEILAYISNSIAVEPEPEESLFTFEEDDAVKAIIYAEIINKREY